MYYAGDAVTPGDAIVIFADASEFTGLVGTPYICRVFDASGGPYPVVADGVDLPEAGDHTLTVDTTTLSAGDYVINVSGATSGNVLVGAFSVGRGTDLQSINGDRNALFTFYYLVSLVGGGTVVGDAGNTTSAFKTTGLSGVPATDFIKGYKLSFYAQSTANFAIPPVMVMGYDNATGFVTVSPPLPIVPSDMDVFMLFDSVFADVRGIAGVDSSANHLKDLVDTGYNAATHKVAEVALCDTLTGYIAPDNAGIAAAEASAASAASSSAAAATSAASADSKATNIQGRIPAALTGAGNMKSDALAIDGVAAAAVRLALSAGQMIPATVDTTVNGNVPTASEFQADDITEATSDFFKGRLVLFASGDLAGQAAEVTAYQRIGGIGQFTVSTMTGAPANDDTFIIV